MKYKVMIVEKQKEEYDRISYLVKLNNDKFILNIYTTNKYDNNKNFSKDQIQEARKYTYGDYIEINGKITISEMLGNIR